MLRQAQIVNQLGDSHTQAGTRVSGLRQQLATARAGSLSMNAAVLLLQGSLKALGAAAAVAVTAIKVLTGAMRGLLTAVTLLPRAFGGLFNALRRVNKFAASVANRMFRIGNSIRFLGTSMTFLISLPILGFLKGMTDAAIGFESAFVGVLRTVDDPALGEAFTLIEEGSTDINNLTAAGEQLRQKFRDMALEIPLPVTELAKLGEVAGTLGVRGNENIDSFVRTVAKLGVTTNVSSEQAATSLAKVVGVAGTLSDAELAMQGFTQEEIANISESERFQATMDGVGGVLVALGNKTRAQEDAILQFSEKIAATGKIAGITTPQILAIGSSFASVGVNAARGTTAFQKAVFRMLGAVEQGGEHLELFAAVTGRTTEEFSTLFREDASQAFEDFINGLSANGDKAVTILDELELGNERVRQSLLSLAGAEGELSRELTIANTELAEQAKGLSALELEAGRRFETTEAQLQLLKNQFNDLGITIGSFVLPVLNQLITFARGLIESFADLSPAIQKTIITIGILVAAVGPVITFVGLFIGLIGFVASTVLGAISVLFTLASVLGLLILPILAVAAAIGGLAIAFAASLKKIDAFRKEARTTLVERMWEFGKNLIITFAKGMAVAMSAVVQVLIGLGRLIASFLQAFSPPKLLPDLDKWGENAMLSYLEGWGEADFDVFNDIAGKIEGFMKSIEKNLDEAGKKNLAERILGTRKEIAKAVNEFKKFGKITEQTMNRIFKAMGGASQNVKSYVTALLSVATATEMVKKAQEELNAVTRKYEQELRPISDRLKEINRIQQGVADAQRIEELQQILADPRATEQVRMLARLEIEEIGLEQETAEIEDQRDIEIQRAEAKIEAAELELEAAESTLAAAEALLDVQIKNNNLIQEMKDAVESMKDAIESLDLGDISGPLDLDPGEGEDGEFEFDFDIDDSIEEIIGDVNTAFNELVTELKDVFAPLGPQWEELGDVWAPIFDRIGERLSESLGGKFGEVGGFVDDVTMKVRGLGDAMVGFFVNIGLIEMPADLQGFIDDAATLQNIPSGALAAAGPGVGAFFDEVERRADALTTGRLPELGTKLEEPFTTVKTTAGNIFGEILEGIGAIGLQLIDLGIIEPFGPFENAWNVINAERDLYEKGMEQLSAWEAGEGPIDAEWLEILQEMREEGPPAATIFERIAKWARELWESFAESEIGQKVIDIFETLWDLGAPGRAFFMTLFDQVKTLVPLFSDLWESIRELWAVISESGALEIFFFVLKAIGAFLGGVFAVILSTTAGILVGFVRGLINAVTGIINVLTGLWQMASGIIDVLQGVWEFLQGMWATITGDTDAATEHFTNAIEKFKEGILNIFAGLINAIISLFVGLWETVTGLFWGFIDTVIGFWTHLYNMLVGNSIIPDLVNDIIQWFLNLFNGVIQWITDLVTGAIEWFTNFATDVITGVGTFVTDVIAFFEDIYNGIIGWITDLVTEGPAKLLEFVTGILDTLGGLVSEAATKALEIGQAIIDGIKDAITGGVGGLLEAGREAVGGLLQGAKDFLGIGSPSKEFIEIGKETINGLVDGLKTAQAALEKMVKTTVDTFIDGFSGVFKAVAKIWNKGTKTNINDTKKWLATLLDMTDDWGNAMIFDGEPSLIGSVFGIINNDYLPNFASDFISIYEDFLLRVVSTTKVWGDTMALDGSGSLFGSVFIAIIDMFETMVEVFVVSLPLFLEMWDDLLENILQKFIDIRPAFYQAGASLIDSLGAGMISRAQALYNTARGIADGVTDAVNDAYDQDSPSRVFIGVGDNIMEGWRIGIEGGQAGILAAMGRTASGLLSAASVRALPLQTGQQPVHAPAPVSSATIINNAEVNMGGQVISSGIDQVLLQILIEQALRNVL
jgi:TP901 family phage tail tape measure protein